MVKVQHSLKEYKWPKILSIVKYSYCFPKVIQENHIAEAVTRKTL